MADTKISALTSYAAPISTDVLPIVDITNLLTKKVAFSVFNPLTTLGDLVYGGASGVYTRLAGDTSNTRKFLRTVSAAGVAAAPAWDTLVSGDIPDLSATYSVKAGNASLTTVGTITTGTWNATKIGLAYGGTNADLSATGGANQFLKQTSVGGAVTVAAITNADLLTTLTPQFAKIGIGIAAQTDPLWIENDNAGPIVHFTLYNGNTTNGNSTDFNFRSDTSGVGAASKVEFGLFRCSFDTHDNGTSAASFKFYTRQANAEAARLTIGAGLQVGAPTGGDQGAGTINVSSNIYLNGSAYTNPDYALEYWAKGKIEKYIENKGAKDYRRMTLGEIEQYARENLRLPGITGEMMGVVERFDFLLEKVEELYTHLFEMNKKLNLEM